MTSTMSPGSPQTTSEASQPTGGNPGVCGTPLMVMVRPWPPLTIWFRRALVTWKETAQSSGGAMYSETFGNTGATGTGTWFCITLVKVLVTRNSSSSETTPVAIASSSTSTVTTWFEMTARVWSSSPKLLLGLGSTTCGTSGRSS